MNLPYIPILLGTSRQNSCTKKVAEYLASILKEDDRAKTELLLVEDFMQDMTIPPWQRQEAKKTEEWRNTAQRADAFIIVVPEYNHGYPGELKLVLDQEFDNYKGKPVLTCGTSAGRFGGTRVVEHLLGVYNELGLVNVPYPLYFSEIHNLFEKPKKQIGEQYRSEVEDSFDKLLLYLNYLDGLNKELKQD